MKNMTPEDKLFRIVQRIYNPFEKVNFNRTQLSYMDSEEFNEVREFDEPDPETPPSIARLLFDGAPLNEEA